MRFLYSVFTWSGDIVRSVLVSFSQVFNNLKESVCAMVSHDLATVNQHINQQIYNTIYSYMPLCRCVVPELIVHAWFMSLEMRRREGTAAQSPWIWYFGDWLEGKSLHKQYSGDLTSHFQSSNDKQTDASDLRAKTSDFHRTRQPIISVSDYGLGVII